MDSYHVLEQVGEGSFGRVYKGRKKCTGQVVALKFVPKVGRAEKDLQSLKREIDIMRDLKHPNIVQLFDSIETEQEVVIVTEYADGQLFQLLLDDGNLSESRVRDIACQLVRALHYLHSHRILHRDMKPQNILLGKNSTVKLCDFGFARAMSKSTFMLTSIKGTPLYMAPELLEEKPYDHNADLWSLGCILYELHTGVPPFYANSILQLLQLIVKSPVKWPDTMSASCTSFLKGLLTKDPHKRLSWPDLLLHPFIADGVEGLSDTGAFNRLTVRPSPDLVAMKLKQVAEKMKRKDEGRKNLAAKIPSITSGLTAANQRLRSQISLDYEREFPSVEIGPRMEWRRTRERQDVDSEDYWMKLVEKSDPSRQQKEFLNHSVVIPEVKSRLQAFESQLKGGVASEAWRINLPLKVLQNLILTSDLEKLTHIGREVELPHLLFDLVNDAVENCHLIQEPSTVEALGEIIVTLLTYWEMHPDWVEEQRRLEEFTQPFITILQQTHLSALAPLAASVLSVFVQHGVDVKADADVLTSLLQKTVCGSHELWRPLPVGWGLCDGLLSLHLHSLCEHEKGSLHSDVVLSLDLWSLIGSSLAAADTHYFSVQGLGSFLFTVLLVFTHNPYSCVPLFSQSKACVCALVQLLNSECPGSLTDTNFSELGCHLLCFPFALDVAPDTVSRILHVYDSCGVVPGLLQVTQTLPPPHLEKPLSLLSCLLLCDPENAGSHISRDGSGFFSAAKSSCENPTGRRRSAGSLLSDLLQQNVTWESAVELLTVLSLAACCSGFPSQLHLDLEASVFHQTLEHPYPRVRAAACRLLANLDPFLSHTLTPSIFTTIGDRLHDSSVPVRRMACRAVGNWLGCIALRFTTSRPHDKGTRPTDKPRRVSEEAEGPSGEGRGWIQEARRTGALLAPLITDADAVTRRHACEAVGNLVYVDGSGSVLLDENVCGVLLKVACTDSQSAVRQAAIASLCVYSQQDAIRQVLLSLDSRRKLVLAARHAGQHKLQCDYQVLIGRL